MICLTVFTGIDINSGTIDVYQVALLRRLLAHITGTSFVSSGNITFGDNDKAIFGAGSDLQIYHDGSNSYIDDVGTGDLYTSVKLKA